MSLDRNPSFLELFIDVTKAITASLAMDDVFKLITQKIPVILAVDAATIRLLNPATKKLNLVAAYGLSDAYLDRGAIDTEEPVFKALEGEPLAIEDAGNDPRIQYPISRRDPGRRHPDHFGGTHTY